MNSHGCCRKICSTELARLHFLFEPMGYKTAFPLIKHQIITPLSFRDQRELKEKLNKYL